MCASAAPPVALSESSYRSRASEPMSSATGVSLSQISLISFFSFLDSMVSCCPDQQTDSLQTEIQLFPTFRSTNHFTAALAEKSPNKQTRRRWKSCCHWRRRETWSLVVPLSVFYQTAARPGWGSSARRYLPPSVRQAAYLPSGLTWWPDPAAASASPYRCPIHGLM